MSRGNARATLEREEIDELKARVDLVALIESSGVALRKVGKNLLGRCPFHEDHESSLSVNTQARLWNCFGCQTGGDALRFLQLKENLEFPQALERMRGLAGAAPLAPVKPKPQPTHLDGTELLPGGLSRSELMNRVADLYAQNLKECPQAQEYLASRGLDRRELWEAFRVGFAAGKTLPQEGPVKDALVQLGLLTPRGREHFLGCVVVPLEHPDQGVVGFYGRKIDPADKVPHLYLPGPKRGVLNWQTLKLSRQVVLAESVLDALALWQAGCKEVSCLYGVQGLPVDLDEALARYGVREAKFCLDGDRAGREAATRLGEQLTAKGLRCVQVVFPEGEDPNSLLVAEGATALRERLQRAEPMAWDDADAFQVEALRDGFKLRFGDTEYRVQPLAPFTGRLQASLKVTRGKRRAQDKLDLLSHRSRSLTVTQFAKLLDLPKEAVEEQILAVLDQAELWVEAITADESGEEPAVHVAPELSEAEKAEAREFLRQPNLVKAILADMETLGYVGEEKTKLLGYLIGISRKLLRPLSGIVISQAGAGKSGLTELVEALTPKEDVILYSRLSQLALFFMPRDFLKNKLVILEERVGAEAAEYSIRVLQSRRRLTQAVVMKDAATGKMSTRHYEVEGPIAYLETTTNHRINYENATRCFELTLDESVEQTQRIHQRQRRARTVAGLLDSESGEEIQIRHHNAQRVLEPVRVVIPFVDLLTFPSRWIRTRRDNERFLSLIETITFLHQAQRVRRTLPDHPEVAYVEATVDDYRLAYSLAQDVLGSTFHELSRDGRELLEAVTELTLAAPNKQVQFTRRTLRQKMTWVDRRLGLALGELVQMEYLGTNGGNQGQTFQYWLLEPGEEGPPLLRELTTPAQLLQLLQTSAHKLAPVVTPLEAS